MDGLHLAVVHGARDGGAGHQVAAVLGEDDGGASAADMMAGAADALHPAGDRRRRFNLHHEIDGAHVDAQFERRRGDEPAQRAHFEAVFDLLALVGGHAAVVRAHQSFAGKFVDGAGDAFGQAAAVDEDEGGGVGAHQFEQLGMDGAPYRRTHGGLRGGAAGQRDQLIEARHVVERNFDAQVDPLGLAGIDDGDVAVDGRGGGGFEFAEDLSGGVGWGGPPGPRGSPWTRSSFGGRGSCAAEEAGDLVQRALRGGESDALQLAAAQGFEAFQREGEMAAPLGRHKRVNFVQHHGLDGAQHFARVGGEQEVDGFRRGDQDIGGVTGETCALGSGRVAGADGDGGFVKLDSGGAGGLGDAHQWGAQVAFDIDGEGLDGRNVEYAAALMARRDGREHQAIDAPQEGGERFAGARGGED